MVSKTERHLRMFEKAGLRSRLVLENTNTHRMFPSRDKRFVNLTELYVTSYKMSIEKVPCQQTEKVTGPPVRCHQPQQLKTLQTVGN